MARARGTVKSQGLYGRNAHARSMTNYSRLRHDRTYVQEAIVFSGQPVADSDGADSDGADSDGADSDGTDSDGASDG